jgi:hypothetical protein
MIESKLERARLQSQALQKRETVLYRSRWSQSVYRERDPARTLNMGSMRAGYRMVSSRR